MSSETWPHVGQATGLGSRTEALDSVGVRMSEHLQKPGKQPADEEREAE
jgi:hypothetical protein